MKPSSLSQGRIATGGMLLVLLIVACGSQFLPNRGVSGIVRWGIFQARGRNSVWWNNLWKSNNGYYEQLMEGEGDPRIVETPLTRLFEGKAPWADGLPSIYVDRGGYLITEARPNMNFIDPLEGPIRTNSYGLFDTEHSLNKAANTRRIAVLGDSIGRGWCVAQEERFDTLTGKQLDAELGHHFEFINFSVSGYRMTQIFDVAMEKAPVFHPDTYIVMLTQLSITPTWGEHLVRLVNGGRNLKYDFLRQIVQESGLRKDDSASLREAKLAPYRFRALREMLVRMQAHAEEQSADLIVVLVPSGEDPEVTANHFRGVKQALDGTEIPVVDLLDTFDSVDVATVRRDWFDAHPNALGQRLIAENLQRKVRLEPEAWAAITGMPVLSQRALSAPPEKRLRAFHEPLTTPSPATGN